MDVFGIPLDNLSRQDVLGRIKNFLIEPSFHRIATVNPEFLLLAEKNHAFKQTLLQADLRVVDGVGVVLVGLLRRKKLTRFPGADLLAEILRIAEEQHLLVYLALRQGGLSTYQETKVALLKKYPTLIVHGSEIEVGVMKNWNLTIRNSVIILCNFGAPEQEMFLYEKKHCFPEARLVVGVGGSFDYLTGGLPRAPKILRVVGLEWLWRFILQPKRFKRIWNATIVFLVKALCQK